MAMARNFTRKIAKNMLCKSKRNVLSNSIWKNSYVLTPSNLLTAQLAVISLSSKFIDLWLYKLGQTSVVSQIMAGILLGPSLLGQYEELARVLFPRESRVTLSTIAAFGNMFYHFLNAVKTDPVMVLRPGRVAVFIATSAFSITLVLSLFLSLILKRNVKMNAKLHNSLSIIAMSQAFTGISVVSYLVTELKLQNTDVGRLSLATAVVTDLLNTIMVTVSFFTGERMMSGQLIMMWAVLTTFAVVSVVFFVFRPIILALISYMPAGKPVDQKYIFLIIILTLVLGFVSEVIGQHYVFGPALLGLIVPDGPPLGACLVSKLDTFILEFLYPTYLAISGLQTNVFDINPQDLWIVGILVIFGITVKTVTVVMTGKLMNLSTKEAFVLAMVLNSKGILELTVYNFWKDNKILDGEEFSVCVLSLVLTTAIITPLIRYLYDPSKQFQPFRRNTIQHSKPNSELKILVCIHKAENVPTIFNLLEISHATLESPIAVISMVLVELIGRYTPVLISNDHYKSPHNQTSTATRIANALRQYEQNNQGCTTVQSFTSISLFETMHDDIFRVATDTRVTIVIMPYHRQWAIDGDVDSSNASIRRLNKTVLDKAPCSVGILIDRGILRGSANVKANKSKLNVAIIFVSGPDDEEALAYGARMAKNDNVILTVIQFVLFGSENCLERKRNSDLIHHYKQANMRNERFLFLEEVVKDGVGLSQCIGKIDNFFDLILVGRYHRQSPLFEGLEAWSECPELGVVGDMLASPDFKTTASVLVLQQQKIRSTTKKKPSNLVVPLHTVKEGGSLI